MGINIAWREGLFIQPQHFQQSSYYLNDEMMKRSILSGPNLWGLFDLEIDDQLLSQGKFSVAKASGILPDGTLFHHQDFVERLTISLTKKDSGQAIYLSLPLNYPGEDNIYFEESKESFPTRYIAKTHLNILNTNIGEETKTDIIFSHPQFMLLKESELKSGVSSIKIAQIGSISANHEIALDASFIPTFLHLDKSPVLMQKLGELQGMLRYRAEKLAEKLTGGHVQAAELGDYLTLQILNRAESRIHYFQTQEKSHPGALYFELSSILGELAVFLKREKRLTSLYTYTHEEQGESLLSLFADAKEMLGQVLESASSHIPLKEHKYGVRIAIFPDKSILSDSSLILAVSSNLDDDKLKKVLMDNLKISTVEEISNLVNHHLPGFKIKALPAAPREIPHRINQNYFRIMLSREEIAKLQRASGLALHYPKTANLTIDFTLWAIKAN